jgi:tetratricopeptide (TPR) repeat protein
MLRRMSGRRSCLVLLALLLSAFASDSRAQEITITTVRDLSRLERLELWASALQRHEPGAPDDALQVFSGWAAQDLAELKITFHSTLQLILDPGTRIFWRPPSNDPQSRATSSRAVQVFYSLEELRQLIDVAAGLRRLGYNHVLKRAAMLHTDAMLLGSRADSRGGGRSSDVFTIRVNDGQEVRREDATGHFDMARFALDRVRRRQDNVPPDPASDDWVRRWYRTVMTHMIGRFEYTMEVANRGVEIFRNDTELLFLAGVMHETLASPGIQEALRNADYNLRSRIGVFTRKAELDASEDLLRRVLKINPAFTEARLHLGRVLAELGRHKDALPELTNVLPSIQDSTVQYYGQMLLGRSAAETGNAVAARAAFERASQLVPAAQSPLLALSQLAYSRGDPGGAAALLARVAELPADEAGDPWWYYHRTVGRFFDVSWQDLVETLRAEMPR